MTPIVYLDGTFLPEADARVGISDGGWLHGAGLFETMRAENRKIFRLESHLERIRRSAAELLRPLEHDDLPSAADFAELLKRNDLESARVRMTVSAGSMIAARRSGANSAQETGPLTVCVTAFTLSTYPAKVYEDGIGVIICRFKQSSEDPIAGHKTTAYFPRLLGLRQAHQAKCMEAIWFTTDKELAEGSISNVFLVHDGVLKTPPTTTPVLPGIARGVVLEMAGELGIETRETRLTIDDLLDADECFLTNTIMQILPVIRVEQRDIGGGKVGPLTKQLRLDYLNLVRKECGTA